MRAKLLMGLGLGFVAGGACAAPYDDGFESQAYHRNEYVGASPWYPDGRRPQPACDCRELRLPASFFEGSGGVGPIPEGGYYGGGYGFFVTGPQGAASARAFAGASASTRFTVSVQGGGRHKGGHRGGHGRK
jgi:hypothetical protein